MSYITTIPITCLLHVYSTNTSFIHSLQTLI